MTPSSPQEWQKRKGVRLCAVNALKATGRAVSGAFRDTWDHAQHHAVTPILLAAGLAVLLLTIGQPIGRALLSFGALVVVAIGTFLVLLFWTPFRDHRKLVWERDHYIEQVRTVHLRYHANDWRNWSGNELRNLRGIKQRRESFDPENWMSSVLDFTRRKQKDLEHWGQPVLAAEMNVAPMAPWSMNECVEVVERLHMLFKRWSCGVEIPPFSEGASGEGLRLPMLYGP